MKLKCAAASSHLNYFNNLGKIGNNFLEKRSRNKDSCLPRKLSTKKEKNRNTNSGVYYGLGEEILKELKEKINEEKNIKCSIMEQKVGSEKKELDSSFDKTITEYRLTMKELKDSLSDIKKEIQGLSDLMKQSKELQDEEGDIYSIKNQRWRKQKKYDAIAKDVEEWAQKILKEGSENGWDEVFCNKMFRHRYNRNGNIKCFLKWMPDSRDEMGDSSDDEYPCLKLFATIDAPLEEVCNYLSDSNHVSEYNDLVIEHHDIESIAPYAKICWAACPKILIVKPRDFVTFCCLKWKKDGTQIVLNQAVEHENKPPIHSEGDGKYCRALALRGANIISRHPEYNDKTLLALITHASTGGNIPKWSIRTIVKTIAPIEPFKLCYKIEKRVQASMAAKQEAKVKMTSSSPTKGCRPGGLSQLGYACFWPEGGGLVEIDDKLDENASSIQTSDDGSNL